MSPSTSVPFSVTVGGTEWRTTALTWLEQQLGRLDISVTGPVEQPRIRPWSTQLVAPTTEGTMWFKANCPAAAFEPALQQLLADLAPSVVDRPVAVEPDRGWLVTRDRGPALGDTRSPTLADWQALLRLGAQVQRATPGQEAAILATGVPDRRPSLVPALFDDLLARLAQLPRSHPSRLDGDGGAALVAVRPRLVEAAEQLAASPLPTTLQHADLHPRNVFVLDHGSSGPERSSHHDGSSGPDGASGALRLFDLGDAQWAHALELLCVPRRIVDSPEHTGADVAWAPIAQAYREQWGDLVSATEFDDLLAAATLTHAVNRTSTWLDLLRDCTAAEIAAWGEAPALQLQGLLTAAT
jgi:hypothetical protein